jgi:hypothetical protein
MCVVGGLVGVAEVGTRDGTLDGFSVGIPEGMYVGAVEGAAQRNQPSVDG